MRIPPDPRTTRSTTDCPSPRSFRPTGDLEILLRRMEDAVDEIVTAVTALGAVESAKAGQDHLLRVAAAARRLSGLTARWRREAAE